MAQAETDSTEQDYFWVDIDTIRLQKGIATQLSECNLSSLETPQNGKLRDGVFLVEDYILCRKDNHPNFLFKIFDGTNSYYVKSEEVVLQDKNLSVEHVMQFFAEMKTDEKEKYKTDLKEFVDGLIAYTEQKEKYEEEEPIRQSINETLKQPLVIYDFGFPEEYSFTGFRVEVLNTSKKRIKYISFNVIAYNEVDDPIRTFGGSYSKTLRGVGPVEAGGSAAWNFENIWYDNTFHTGRINSVTVEYFDGTKITFTKLGSMIFSDEERALFDRYLDGNSDRD